jgi:hypothetical protein
VDPQRLVQRPVERGAVITKLLPEPLLRLGLDEVGRRGVDMLLLLLQVRRESSARRRGSAPSTGCLSAASTSPRATRAPAEASGADAGGLAHWSQPGGGTSSSSGISTTTVVTPAFLASNKSPNKLHTFSKLFR